MAVINFLQKMHSNTKRDYIKRVVENDKSECSVIAKKFSFDYWDGDRKFGYGGYRYDGRWEPLAKTLIKHYNIIDGQKILDVCCGKGYLLFEFKKILPNLEIIGLDISKYAIENGKPEIKENLILGNASDLPFKDNEFDFVISLGGLHNLKLNELFIAIKEIERVGNSKKKYIMVESWESEKQKTNLLYWQLTCESFFDTKTWKWIFKVNNYSGDCGFIFFD